MNILARLAAATLAAFTIGTVTAPTADALVDTPVTAEGAAWNGVFRPVNPVRAFDSRDHGAAITATTVELAKFLPTGAIAAAVTITTTGATKDGFVTVWPAGQDRPGTSILNQRLGAVVANSTVVPLGTNGAISLFANQPAHIVIDVTGAWIQAPVTDLTGRVQLLPVAERVLDTRDTGTVRAGSTVTAKLTNAPVGATGVVVNVTAADGAAGFWTAWGTGAKPLASIVSSNGDGAVASGTSFLTIDDTKQLSLYSQTGGNVVVDVAGWIGTVEGKTVTGFKPGTMITASDDGMIDTRTDASILPGPRVWDDRDTGPGTRDAIRLVKGTTTPNGTTLVNLTVVDGDAGFARVWPLSFPEPTTSNVNVPASGATVAATALVGSSSAGLVTRTQAGGFAITDAVISFTGARKAGTVSNVTITPDATVTTESGDTTGPWTNHPSQKCEGVNLGAGTVSMPTVGINVVTAPWSRWSNCHAGSNGPIIDSGRATVDHAMGANGRTMLVGAHRTSHGGVFRHVIDLNPGDPITLTEGGISRTFHVTDVKIVSEAAFYHDLSWTAPDGLLIYSCSGPSGQPGWISHRVVVFAV